MMLNPKDVERSVLSSVMAPGTAVANEIVMHPRAISWFKGVPNKKERVILNQVQDDLTI